MVLFLHTVLFTTLGAGTAIRSVLAQGLQDVGIFQAIDQFLGNTGNIGRAVIGFFAGVEGLGGIGKEVHVEWDALRCLYSFELRVESTVMVLRTLAQYNYVSPIGIFRCNPVPDSDDPDQLLAACAKHSRSVTVANASTQYVFLCVGMGLVAVICIIKRPFDEGTYFTATAAFLAVVFGGSVRICRTEYTAHRTVMELSAPTLWPRGDALHPLITGVDKQLAEVPGLFESELRLARHCISRAVRALAMVVIPQIVVVMLWLGSSPWTTTKWISIALAPILGIVSMLVNYCVGTAAFLLRVEGRDPRGIRECIASVWLMLNGVKFTRRMHRFLSGARTTNAATLTVATRWWRVFEACTAFSKVLIMANVVLLGCGPLSGDTAAKAGFLGGMLVWSGAAFGNGKPF